MRLCRALAARIGDGASFEASLPEAPQDEELFSMPSKAFLMLRSAHRARLEARTTSVGVMEFRIADTFTASLARLNGAEQKAAKTTAFDLQLNLSNPRSTGPATRISGRFASTTMSG
jgi:hypothetical protein